MSKVNKSKDNADTTKTQSSTNPAQTNKKKKKHFAKLDKKKRPPKKQLKTKSQQTTPPTDPQHFSANWKALLETLTKSQPVKQIQSCDASQKLATKKTSFKEATQIGPSPSTDAGDTATRHKAPCSKEVEGVGQVTGKRRKATKKIKENGKREGEQPAKKGKTTQIHDPPTEADLWFDDVDPDDVEAAVGKEVADVMRNRKEALQRRKLPDSEDGLVKTYGFPGLTRTVAMDCEMVGVGPDSEDSILARVSIVNLFGKCIYDKFVRPTEKVTDYRTAVSGIRPEDIRHGEEFQTVQKEVAQILEGRTLVGHAIHNDLKVLFLDHPKKKIRDTQKYKPFKQAVKSSLPSLKVLCREMLNVKVQQGEHSSVQDAQATMRLYTMVKKNWEVEIKASGRPSTGSHTPPATASSAAGNHAPPRKPCPSSRKPHPSRDK